VHCWGCGALAGRSWPVGVPDDMQFVLVSMRT